MSKNKFFISFHIILAILFSHFFYLVYYNKTSPINDSFISKLKHIIPEQRIFFDKNNNTHYKILESHGHDMSMSSTSFPELVVYSINTLEIIQVMKLAYHYRVPVTVRGSGTGLAGGSVPINGGMVLNLEKMNKIIKLYDQDQMVSVQPGVLKSQLNDYLKPNGYFFPCDPGSDASMGGQASTGASGTTSLRYGTFIENVINLQVVLVDGSLIPITRSRTRKSSTGLDMTHIFLSSEGTMGIITELTLKIRKIPQHNAGGVSCFPKLQDLTEAVNDLRSLHLLSRCELLNSYTIEMPTLFLDFHGDNKDEILNNIERAREICLNHNALSFIIGMNEEEKDILWKARRSAFFMLLQYRRQKNPEELRKQIKIYASDVCVPLSHLTSMVTDVEEYFIRKIYSNIPQLQPYLIGHVMDGNFHMLIPINISDHKEREMIDQFNNYMMIKGLQLEGTISGEHGIGLEKSHYLLQEHGSTV